MDLELNWHIYFQYSELSGFIYETSDLVDFLAARNTALTYLQGQTQLEISCVQGLETFGVLVVKRVGRQLCANRGRESTFLAHYPIRDEEFTRRFGVRNILLYEFLHAADYVSLHALLDEGARGGMVGVTDERRHSQEFGRRVTRTPTAQSRGQESSVTLNSLGDVQGLPSNLRYFV